MPSLNIIWKRTRTGLITGFALLSYCVELDPSNKVDYSIIPSFFGTGTFLAWVIAGIDLHWDSWTVKLASTPRAEDDSIDVSIHEYIGISSYSDPRWTPATIYARLVMWIKDFGLQSITVGAYFYVGIIWILFSIFKNVEYKVLPKLCCHLLQTMVLLDPALHDFGLLMCISNPYALFFQIMRGFGHQEPTKLSEFTEYVMLSVFVAPLFARVIGFLPPDHKSPSHTNFRSYISYLFRLTMNIAWRSCSAAIIMRNGIQIATDSTTEQRGLRFRAPWPRTSYGLSDLDQAFALGLALAYLLRSRGRSIIKTLGQCWICIGFQTNIIIAILAQRWTTRRTPTRTHVRWLGSSQSAGRRR